MTVVAEHDPRADASPGLTRSCAAPNEDDQMIWETPAFVEIRMDAEIGSYQEDDGPGDSPYYAAAACLDDAATTTE
jgi:hypothetical protein